MQVHCMCSMSLDVDSSRAETHSSLTVSCECGVCKHLHIPTVCSGRICSVSLSSSVSALRWFSTKHLTSSLSQHPLCHSFKYFNCFFYSESPISPYHNHPCISSTIYSSYFWDERGVVLLDHCLRQVSATISAATLCSEMAHRWNDYTR